MTFFSKSLRYKFDNFLSKGGKSIFLSLVLVFLSILIFLAIVRGILVSIFPPETLPLHYEDLGFWGNSYITFLEITDPGNMAQDINSSGWYKLIAILAGMSGVVIFSALIAFITTALDQKIKELKRGHSQIIEKDHTLILGWNQQRVLEIIRELVIANESEENPCVVILADKDKEEMDEILKLSLPDTKNLRIVTRSGNTASATNLEIVAANKAKSIVILASCEDACSAKEKEISDAKIIQTILALTNEDQAEKNGKIVSESTPIVAEIYNKTHREIVKNHFRGQVISIDTSDILAKILVQTSRSVGLSVVYNEILSFEDCEMYFHQDDWNGATFEELTYRFDDGVLMGICSVDSDTGEEKLILNPPSNYRMKKDDEVLVLADDDSTIKCLAEPILKPKIHDYTDLKVTKNIERELILGWTEKVPNIIREYDEYVEKGSKIDLMLTNPNERIVNLLKEINLKLENIEVNILEKNRLSLEDLISISPFTYDNIIILAETGENSIDGDSNNSETGQRVDSANIVVLLLLREIFEKNPKESEKTKLITEVVDSQNQSLIAKAGVKDMIISNKLISMMFTQISEDNKIKKVYDDLFAEDGSEIYLKPLSLYFKEIPEEVSFADLMAAARARGEICLGVKILDLENDNSKNYGVSLNPKKSKTFKLSKEDSLVVLAEDEL